MPIAVDNSFRRPKAKLRSKLQKSSWPLVGSKENKEVRGHPDVYSPELGLTSRYTWQIGPPGKYKKRPRFELLNGHGSMGNSYSRELPL